MMMISRPPSEHPELLPGRALATRQKVTGVRFDDVQRTPRTSANTPGIAQTPISLPMPNARLTQLTVSPRPASPAVSGGLSEVRTDVAAGGIANVARYHLPGMSRCAGNSALLTAW
jgi:hypothetical protein